jgi:hypothetical protein
MCHWWVYIELLHNPGGKILQYAPMTHPAAEEATEEKGMNKNEKGKNGAGSDDAVSHCRKNAAKAEMPDFFIAEMVP